MMSVNLDGAWYCCKAAIPIMKAAGYGKIIQVGSVKSVLGSRNSTHYIASKMGVVGMTRGLARDLGPHGIRVNCVVLGAIRVAAEKMYGDAHKLDQEINANQCVPVRLSPADVRLVFAFLASAGSDAITGQSITVDAGWTHTA